MRNCIYALICFLILTACKNDDDVAPPITAENTFSCKINGDLFVPQDFGSFPNSFDGIQAAQNSSNHRWLFKFGNGDSLIYIYLINVTTTGDYIIKMSDGDANFFDEVENVAEFSALGNFTPTHKSTNSSGAVRVLELELETSIILEFDELTLVGNNDPNNIITLTEGKLNINLETL